MKINMQMEKNFVPSIVRAIGFDLFNTLITARSGAVEEAVDRLLTTLREEGFSLEKHAFEEAYKENASLIINQARKNGRETHNRFWISATLKSLGYDVDPDDPRISLCVRSYFSAFFDYCEVIPETIEMLRMVRSSYKIGLLSNFTHPPAAEQLMQAHGLKPFFDFILISGALGYRKPHPFVFNRLRKEFAEASEHILYVGDDPDPDINGARRAGMQAVWFTYARDHHIPTVPGVGPSGPSTPAYNVPRISTWKEFLILIGCEHDSM